MYIGSFCIQGHYTGYMIKINCLVSVGAEMSYRNIKLWNSSVTRVVLIKFCSLLCYSKFGPLCKFLFSTLVLISDFLFLFLPFLIDLKFYNVTHEAKQMTNAKAWEFWTGTVRINNRFGFQCKIFSSSEIKLTFLPRL